MFGSTVKNPPTNARDVGSTPRSGRSPGEGNGNPFQYSCLGNPMNRGAWWATVHEVAEELDMTEWLNHNDVKVYTKSVETGENGGTRCVNTDFR